VFWKYWRSKFGSVNKCQLVDGCVDDELNADKFAYNFSESYSCNNACRGAQLRYEYDTQQAVCYGLPLTAAYLFDTELVSTVLSKLTRGKAAGLDHLSAEHLLYSHPAVMCRLFSFMLLSGYASVKFGSHTRFLYPVEDVRTKAVSGFRGVAVSSVISKILESCKLDRLNFFLTLL
jgi:hypothetical protein